MRDGYVARWRGEEYEVSPDATLDALRIRLYRTDPADGFEEVTPERYQRAVPVEELERLTYVVTVCSWQGAPFRVIAARDVWLRLEYTGGQAPIAQQLGLERVDRGVYQRWVARDEVRDLREESTLLY
jgi:hypothetical protein